MAGNNASADLAQIRTRVIAGGAAGDLTVTGIALGDKLVAVQRLDAAGAAATPEFSITAANTINNTGGTSTAGQVLLVIWEAYAGGRDGVRVPVGRSSY